MTDLDKERLVNAFLRGESVTDLSAFYAVYKASIEDVLREAILGLSRLNQRLANPNGIVRTESDLGLSDTISTPLEPVSTEIEG